MANKSVVYNRLATLASHRLSRGTTGLSINPTRERLDVTCIEDTCKKTKLGAFSKKISIQGHNSPESDVALLEQVRATDEALFMAAMETGSAVGAPGAVANVVAGDLSKQDAFGQLSTYSSELTSNGNIGFGQILLNSLIGGPLTGNFQGQGIQLPAVADYEEVICGICSPDFPGTSVPFD